MMKMGKVKAVICPVCTKKFKGTEAYKKYVKHYKEDHIKKLYLLDDYIPFPKLEMEK